MNFFNWLWEHKKMIVLGCAGILLVFTIFLQFSQKTKIEKPRIYVEVSHPVQKEMIDFIFGTGTIKAERETTVSSKIPGKIKSVLIKEGDPVTLDQLLIQLEAKELKLQTEIAQSAHRRSASAIDEENYKRHKKLLEEGVITQSEFDKIESEYKTAQAEKERLEKTVQLQEEQAASSELKASFSALTAKIFVHEGEVVSPGQPLAMLVNIDSVHVEVPVASKHINKVKKGLEAQVTIESTSQVFHGTIENISPVADPISRTFDVKIKVNNQGHLLKPGMFSKTSIVVDRHPQAWTLPKIALVKKEDLQGSFIYVIKDKKAHRKEIKLGLESAQDIEVLTPLDQEEVVIAGQNELYENAPVTIVTPSAHEVSP